MKRCQRRIVPLIAALLLTAILIAALAIPVSAGGKDAFLLGDLNGDGQRTVIDYIMLKRHVLGTYVIPEKFLPAADMDGSGAPDALDYLLLKRALLGTYAIPEAADPPGEGSSSEALRFAVAFSYLFRTANHDRLLQLEGELGVGLDALNRLVITYLASLSIEGEELLALEREIALQLPSAEELETFLRGLAAWLQTLLPEKSP